MSEEKNSILRHPFIIALVPIITALVAYIYSIPSCPIIEKSELSSIESIENKLYSKNFQKEDSLVFLANKHLFTKINELTNFDLANDLRDEILGNYYKENNKDIFTYVNKLSALASNGKPFHGVTYLYGSAGVGKSFIKEPISKLFNNNYCIIELNKILRVGNKYGSNIKMKPQLKSGNLILGELPNISSPGSFDIKELLTDNGCILENRWKKAIIIDDLDEVHPDTSKLIIEIINDFIKKHRQESPKKFIAFFILGRPEAFSSWMSSTHHDYGKSFKEVNIIGPGYNSLSDIELMVMNHFMFENHKKVPNTNVVENLKQEFINRNYLYLSSSNNLSNSNLAIKRLIENPNYTDKKLKEKLFSDYLARNTSSHSRPKRNEEKGEFYERLLQNIAAKYANSLDSTGYFEVDVSDNIKVLYKPKNKTIDVLRELSSCQVDTLTFNVQKVLEYSGIIDITPLNQNIRRYRFRPFWLHKFLVESRSTRS